MQQRVWFVLCFVFAGCGYPALPPLSDPSDSSLVDLVITQGVLEPAFSPEVTSYTVDLSLNAQTLVVTPTATDPANVTITVNASAVGSGMASSPISLSLGDNTINVVVTTQGGATRTYEVRTNRGGGIAQQAYVKATNTGAGDSFGEYIALDGNTLVVSARGEDSASTVINGNQSNEAAADSGAVYVFVRTGTTWSQQAYLKASNAEGGDGFGASVDISGDTVVVGAHLEDSSAIGINGAQTNNAALGSGAVYVFVRSGTTWTQQAYIKASNTGGSDFFGEAVAVAGDTLAVAARGEDSGATTIDGNQADESATDSGAVYVFVRTGTTWTQQAYLKASNSQAGDNFGFALALDNNTLAVASALEDSAATGVNGNQSNEGAAESGAVYVFLRSGTTWSQQSYLKASNTEAADQFGFSLALEGDSLVVGAIAEDSATRTINGNQADNSAASAGAAYVFVRSGTSWSQQAYLKASNTDTGDQFGASAAIEGNVLVVGADGDDSKAVGVNGDASDNSAQNSGAAYVFYRSGGTWTQATYIKASNANAGDFFRQASLSGGTLAVGAYREDSLAIGINGDQANEAAQNSGAVYILE